MSLETSVKPGHASPISDASIVLRQGNFDKAARALGCSTPAEIGGLLRLNERTIKRAKAGVIGEKMIGNTLRTFTRRKRKLATVGLKPTFETFFEVV